MRIYTNGQEIRRSFGQGDLAEHRARGFAAAFNSAERAESRRPCEPIAADDALRDWLATYRATISRSYEATARCTIERHLAPFFAGRYLGELVAGDAARFAAHMAAKGLSAETTRTALAVLRRVIQLHVEGGTLERNPLVGVGRLVRGIAKRAAHEVPEARIFSRAEVEALIGEAREARRWLSVLLLFLAATGARRGEALGLRWGDVDLRRGLAAIRRARVRGFETSTKTSRARRVPLDASTLPLLEELVRLHAVRAPAPGALVFLSARGNALEERNVSRGWETVRARAGCSGRLHDLRHTFASHALCAGHDPVRVSAWLGHATPATTLRVYAHALLDPAECIVRPPSHVAQAAPFTVRPIPAGPGDARCA